MGEKQRIQWIDVAKGICMLCVIIGHSGISSIKTIVFSFHLTVFFILSGYTLKNDLSVESLAKRFRSLMVPYFVTCMAVTAMDVANQMLLNKVTAVKAISEVVGMDLIRSFMASGSVKTFGTVDIGTRIGAVWFLPALFFAALIAQVMIKYVDRAEKRYMILFFPVLLNCYLAKFIWLPFSVQSAVLAAPLLLLGYDMRCNGTLSRISLKNAAICASIFAVGIITKKSPVYYVSTGMPDYAQSMVCAVASSLLIIYIAKKLQKVRVLAWIGRNSLYILCIHLFEMETMNIWFPRIVHRLGLPWNHATHLAIKMIFILGMTELILWMKRERKKRKHGVKVIREKRDASLDIAKAFLIILMIIGHFDIDKGLRDIIFSFHMAAFVFYSGYCFHPEKNRNIRSAIGRQIKHFLIPYALFGILYVLLTDVGIKTELNRVLLGISYSRKVFADVSSIGPVYFILLLFVTKVIYILIDHYIPDEKQRAITVFAVSLIGQYLGKYGYWLPWSVDCALYCLIFYYAGYCFKKYRVMEYFCERNYSYFLLSCIWAYMIYKGSMEIAVRDYGVYSVTILGAISACVLLYMACRYLYGIFHPWLTHGMCMIGKNTLFILIVHKLFASPIKRMVAAQFTKGHIYYAIIVVALQLAVGIGFGIAYAYIQKCIAKAHVKNAA